MKRILLTAVISLAISGMVYAQQAATTTQPAATPQPAAQGTVNTPTAAQTKQSAQQLLDQANTNATQYETAFDGFKTQNVSNADAATFNRLQHDLTTIEANIASQQQVIQTSLNKGTTVNDQVFAQLQQLIGQHTAKSKELQEFVDSIQTPSN